MLRHYCHAAAAGYPHGTPFTLTPATPALCAPVCARLLSESVHELLRPTLLLRAFQKAAPGLLSCALQSSAPTVALKPRVEYHGALQTSVLLLDAVRQQSGEGPLWHLTHCIRVVAVTSKADSGLMPLPWLPSSLALQHVDVPPQAHRHQNGRSSYSSLIALPARCIYTIPLAELRPKFKFSTPFIPTRAHSNDRVLRLPPSPLAFCLAMCPVQATPVASSLSVNSAGCVDWDPLDFL